MEGGERDSTALQGTNAQPYVIGLGASTDHLLLSCRSSCLGICPCCMSDIEEN